MSSSGSSYSKVSSPEKAGTSKDYIPPTVEPASPLSATGSVEPTPIAYPSIAAEHQSPPQLRRKGKQKAMPKRIFSSAPSTGGIYRSAPKESAVKRPPVETLPPIPVSPGLGSAALNSLQTVEQSALLNEIDQLRAHGVNEFVSLPQLVVCGDQSSGKSSVLEAITEIPFPRQANLCTRFATQIMLRRGPKVEASVKVIPHSSRTPEEKERLGALAAELDNFDSLPVFINGAMIEMGIGEGGSTFARDVLSIEVSGPEKPQLTVVDLPGLIHHSENQADVDLVSELVQDYMKDERTIILAVVSARNDIANQVVLRRARDADPTGARTLGIITKPDAAGRDMEMSFCKLARNEDSTAKLQLGWHVLRNRSSQEKDCSFAARNRIEEDFFKTGLWKHLQRSTVGITALRSRLSQLLFDHIKRELPRVHSEVIEELRKCQRELEQLGSERATFDAQKSYLLGVSEVFAHRCQAAVEGVYEHQFFTAESGNPNLEKRLRALIQKLNHAFAATMRDKGHAKNIYNGSAPPKTSAKESRKLPLQVSREEAVEWVKPYLLKGRGRELPGSYNPLLIGELFREQSKPWDKIARRHVKNVWQGCVDFVREALSGLAAPDVSAALFSLHIEPLMKERLKKAHEELDGLLADRRLHAITYNHYYTDNIEKIRAEKFQTQVLGAVRTFESSGRSINDPRLMTALSSSAPADMDNFACEEVLDCMLAFYKVAYKTFVDNVAVIVVERRLAGELWNILSPTTVMHMSQDLIMDIAQEKPMDKNQREYLESKRRSLTEGLEVCRRALRGFRPVPTVPAGSLMVDSDDDSDDDREEYLYDESDWNSDDDSADSEGRPVFKHKRATSKT